MEAIKRGARFLHAHWLDVSKAPAHVPQLFEVTKVSGGCVYFRPVYDAGIPGSERLGSPSYLPREKFARVVLEWRA